LESRYRLNIDTSTETDGGVRFAARIRVQADDNSDGTVDAGSFSGARFQVGVGGFRVRVGNVSGVHDAAEVVDFFGFEPGLIGQIGHYSTFGGGPIDAFSASSPGGAEGNGGVNGINVKYEAGAFAVMASFSEDLDEYDGNTNVGDYEAFEIGASYEVAGWTFGVGYGEAEFNEKSVDTVLDCGCVVTETEDDFDTDFWTVTASGSIGPADIAFFVGDSDRDDDDTAYGVSGSFPVGASTNIVGSYAGGGADDLDDAYGIGFTHGLGGGVTLSGMVGRQVNENTIADLGVRFNF
jgi:outer membrane protein OmpU